MTNWDAWVEAIRDNPSRWVAQRVVELGGGSVQAVCVHRGRESAKIDVVAALGGGLLVGAMDFGDDLGTLRLLPWKRLEEVDMDLQGYRSGRDGDVVVKSASVEIGDETVRFPLADDAFELSADESRVLSACLEHQA